ncbi:hypothetical protein PWR63_20135 [Paraburkholderia sp. A2WS-5]|uniref:hypothetical protein n=1 Tax=unclassified Paraburkholderia TaxID=2615204 RepID=UPI003B7AF470
MQLAQMQTSKPQLTKVVTSIRGAADAKIISKAGNLYRIALKLIRFRDNFNPRDYEDAANQERIAQFRLAYREGRYVPPPEVEWEDGFAYVVEGHRRILAARQEAVVDLLCLAFTGTAFERRARLHTAAADTRFTPLETAKSLADMKREFPEKSNAEIAAATGRSTQAVEQSLVLDTASDGLKAMITAGQIEAQAAIALIRQHGERGCAPDHRGIQECYRMMKGRK